MRLLAAVCIILVLFQSCVAGRGSYRADDTYDAQTLQKDYKLFQSILEESHPSLYWYTPKDSMDYYFDWGKKQLTDSMKGYAFRQVLSYVIARINCGHTSLLSSGNSRSKDSTRNRVFPLSLKLWPDSMVVIDNLNRRDSVLVRGTVLTGVGGKTFHQLADTLTRYIPSDGYNMTHKLQTLSNRSGFGSMYRAVYGLDREVPLRFINRDGMEQDTVVRVFVPAPDSTRTAQRRPTQRPSRKQRRETIRQLEFRPEDKTAVMELHSFSRNFGIRKFIKQSFRDIRKQGSENLVIDLRSNGGGSVTNSTLLSRYISQQPFKVADSLYAINRNSRYSRHIEDYFFNRLFMLFMTRKKADGNYHFGFFEKKFFKPKKKNHFNGDVYVLTGGNSFSASTLFAQVINGQSNVTFVGEETGGGAYGNTAWLIPEVTLPHTKIRFRLPLFRLVMDSTLPHNGRGVMPHMEVLPTSTDIREGRDFKLEKALELIRQKQ